MIGRRGYRIAERPRPYFRPVPLSFASRDRRARASRQGSPDRLRCRNSRSSGQQRAGQFQKRRWASGGTRQPRANQAPPETIYGKELRYDYTPYPGSRSMQGVLQAF